MRDPTREELLKFLYNMPYASEYNDFDREEAIYWFANDWHGGQTTNLYSVLSTSEFEPGPLAHGPKEMAQVLYEELAHAFGAG